MCFCDKTEAVDNGERVLFDKKGVNTMSFGVYKFNIILKVI